MMQMYLITATILFGFLAVVWSHNSWLNTFIKVAFIGMTGWSIFLLLELSGYVVKVG